MLLNFNTFSLSNPFEIREEHKGGRYKARRKAPLALVKVKVHKRIWKKKRKKRIESQVSARRSTKGTVAARSVANGSTMGYY